MNERYLFRGKRKDNGEWAYGGLDTDWGLEPEQRDRYWIIQAYLGETLVIPETVGQCTGLRDKNGKLIFEGDILKGFHYPFLSDGNHNYYAEVVIFDDCPAFGIYTFKNPTAKVRGISEGNTELMEDWEPDDWEVIGNKWDNPELLEVE